MMIVMMVVRVTGLFALLNMAMLMGVPVGFPDVMRQHGSGRRTEGG